MLVTLLALAGAGPDPARAHPAADLEVGDPIEDELRVLELVPGAWQGRVPRPAWGTRPLLRRTLLPPDSLPVDDPVARLSWIRIERELHRDRLTRGPSAIRGAMPYFARFDDAGDEGTRFDLSARLEGGLIAEPDSARFANFSGLHLRGALGFQNWVLQTHWVIGQVDSSQEFGDPIITGEDVIATSEQTLIGYSAPRDRWGARFGRGRWQWGPGDEGSLLLSRTSEPITALEAHATLLRGELVLTALSANLKPTAGEQMAAHRLEWQPHDGLVFGAAEMVVYSAEGWKPLYLMGLLPYTVVQRLEAEDDPDASSTLRNNVLVSFDAAWRIAPGTRVYGEVLFDDLHARTHDNPDKLGFQVGWDGAGTALGSRFRWNGEYTRLTPYVYTSFFGRIPEAQGRPLGFPTGPDARRLRLRVACDPSPDFELSLIATHTMKGENDLHDPFVPGSIRPRSVWSSIGVVETTRTLGGRVRWWPAGGVDVSVGGRYEWRENAGHVAGRDRDRGRVDLEVRLGR